MKCFECKYRHSLKDFYDHKKYFDCELEQSAYFIGEERINEKDCPFYNEDGTLNSLGKKTIIQINL